MTRTQIHDGIVGLLITAGIVLGLKVATVWLYVTGAIGVLMVSSAFTGFCPVYFLIDQLGWGRRSGQS